jgi:hypothetical protein
MPVNQALCQAAGAKPEDVVEVVMERDAEERMVEARPERMKELAKSKSARKRGDELAFTRKKEIANSILAPSRKRRENGG